MSLSEKDPLKLPSLFKVREVLHAPAPLEKIKSEGVPSGLELSHVISPVTMIFI